MESIKPFIRDIPDFPKPGIIFKDINPLLADNVAFNNVIDHLSSRYEDKDISKIVGIESRGFIFGAALATMLDVGFVPIRKQGKLPGKTIQTSYDLEYGSSTIEIQEDALNKGERVVLIDDVLATGGTLLAAITLLEKLEVDVVESAVLIELAFLNASKKFKENAIYSLISY